MNRSARSALGGQQIQGRTRHSARPPILFCTVPAAQRATLEWVSRQGSYSDLSSPMGGSPLPQNIGEDSGLARNDLHRRGPGLNPDPTAVKSALFCGRGACAGRPPNNSSATKHPRGVRPMIGWPDTRTAPIPPASKYGVTRRRKHTHRSSPLESAVEMVNSDTGAGGTACDRLSAGGARSGQDDARSA